MKTRNVLLLLLPVLLFELMVSYAAFGQTLPYTINNNSVYSDDEVYVAIVGIIDGHVWVDAQTGIVHQMSTSYNTVPGPVISGNMGPGENALYADCFTKLSDIPNHIVNIPQIAGCRIMISFKSQLYLYFFGYSGDPSGYAAPNLANATDPNQGIKYELIELTYNNAGLWCNTTRVDSYQYPMGLEVWGDDFYKKVGEISAHDAIISQWQTMAPAAFQNCLNAQEGIIHFPSKISDFQAGGAYEGYLDAYINSIWSKYATDQLVFYAGDAGVWRGRVTNEQFVFTRDADGQTATISRRPTTIEAMEGSGVLASGGQWDLVVQAQFCAAVTRHAINLNVASGVQQDWSVSSNYYQTEPYNWYCKFWHQSGISYNGLTYAFCYDDVFDQSATIHTPNPQNVTITIGGFNGDTNSGGDDGADDSSLSTFIEAENYSIMSGVEIETCSEGGFNVSYIDTDDYMVYNNITFSTSGSYTFEYRVASLNGGELSLDLNAGAIVLGTVDIPSTNDWQNWTTVSQTVNLDAGTYNLGLYALKGGWNINWLKITPGNNAVLIEAENYTNMSGVESELCDEGGFNVAYIDAGDWMAYNDITFPTSGIYTFEYRVASVDGADLSLDLNAGATVLGTASIPSTGGWQNWATMSQTVSVDAGTYNIGVYALQGGWNLNWIRIYAGALKSTTFNNSATTFNDESLQISVYPNPASQYLYVSGADQQSLLEVFSINGIKVKHTTGTSLSVSDLTKGKYILRVTKQNSVANIPFVKN
ncbi:beta-1,3-glucanase family protein [Geofilum sp. OHC36d9]|uniref:beta-1,3-glucanase family protein n=1 Tax=Geofilum sp. OHC36d9 TaxID=3458413 RepID=UPI0040343C00